MVMPRTPVPDTRSSSTAPARAPSPRATPAVAQTTTGRSGAPAVRLGTSAAPAREPSLSERILGAAGRLIEGAAEMGAEALSSLGWSLLQRFAPQLVPILRQGIVPWLRDRLSAVLRAVTDTFARPARNIGNLVAALRVHFGNLVAWMREAGTKIASNDCSPITEAMERIHQVFNGITGPVIERMRHYADVVKGFFEGLWNRFGAPIVDWIQQVAGDIWRTIQDIGHWLWDLTSPIREAGRAAWNWFKHLIGLGDETEGNSGIVAWFQQKLSDAWNWVSERLAPYKRQLLIAGTIIAGIVIWLSPAGPLVLAFVAGAAILRGIQWLRQNLQSRGGLVQGRDILRNTILPAVISTISRVGEIVAQGANRLTEMIGRMVATLVNMQAIVANSIVSFASGIVSFFVDAFRGFADWAANGVRVLATWIQSGLQRLGGFARRVVSFLEEIAATLRNMLRIGYMLAGRVWNAIPACIRDPFIDWFIPLILRQIPFFAELGASPEAWQQTRAQIMELIHQIFRDFDLFGAMRSAFRLVVRILRIPVDLVLQLLDKAALAWDAVFAAPMRFIENALLAVLRGVGYFMSNIFSHLSYGVTNWLFGMVSSQGITPPASWTNLRDLFNFALAVMGITVDHFFELLARRIEPATVQRIRTVIRVLGQAWDWISTAINEGPDGVWNRLGEALSGFGNEIIGSAIRWVMTRIIGIVSARLTALAASAGLSGILEAIGVLWAAIRTGLEYLPRILRVLITAFDTIHAIATGNLEPGARGVEQGMRLALPAVLGFLANYAGLGGIGQYIREIISSLRLRVDNAILRVIDLVLRVGRWIIDRFRAVAGAIFRWWTKSVPVGEGEERHTLLFAGDEDSAELYVQTSRRRLADLITTLRADHTEANKQQAIGTIETQATLITNLRQELRQARAANNTVLMETKRTAIGAAFDEIGRQLNTVYSAGNYGTESDPIPLAQWPGPPPTQYRILYFGGRLEGEHRNLRPRPQSYLKAHVGEQDETGTVIRAYNPISRATLPGPGGETIGLLGGQGMGRLDMRPTAGPLGQNTTPGGGKLLRAIEPYGFNSTQDDMQLDHVQEIQLGGADDLGNLWPLKSSKNSSKGSILSRVQVPYPSAQRTTGMDLLKRIPRQPDRRFHFRIMAYGDSDAV